MDSKTDRTWLGLVRRDRDIVELGLDRLHSPQRMKTEIPALIPALHFSAHLRSCANLDLVLDLYRKAGREARIAF